VLLHERLRPVQWLSIAIAAAGVIWLTVTAGQLPWIALGLAASFGGYGLLRKTGALGRWKGCHWKHYCCFRLPPPRSPFCF
jgi:chloramphenicol-sensitive protein RarD